MYSFLVVFAFFLAASATDYRQEFEAWKVQYGKLYQAEEEEERYANFVETIKRVARLNAKSTSAKFGLNKFSDMSHEEWKAKYLMPVPIDPYRADKPKFVAPASNENAKVSASRDWRAQGKVTAVKDQGQCGSCWAFSVTETIESAWMMKNNLVNTTFQPLAPQQIVDCDQSDGGCNGGNPPTAYQYVISAGGLDRESAYPYRAMDGTCAFVPGAVGANITSWNYACEERDESTLKSNLDAKGPLSICVDAANWQHYTGGVLSAWECAWVNVLDHCVQLVGYDTSASSPYWIVRNSWGLDWGESGYIRLQYGDNACGLTNEATYAIV